MANCNSHFLEFDEKLRLTDARRKDLIKSRNDLRTKIRKWFEENKPKEEQPKFRGQGSMMMDTIINPIPRKTKIGDEEKTLLYYDVDDGIYFIGDKDANKRVTPETYHSWVYDAVKGHTQTDPIDKNTCIRTIFSNGHHIDHPIYYKKGDIPELAHKRDEWIESDPLALSDWFNNKAEKNQQLRRLVRYGKAWCDFREFVNESQPMPSGLILTILIAENAVYRTDRDDIALKETLQAIQYKLKPPYECKRPTTPVGENLLADYNHIDYFLRCLDNFVKDATKALEERNIRRATEWWRKHLGDRFPLGEDKDENTTSSAGLASIIPPITKPFAW